MSLSGASLALPGYLLRVQVRIVKSVNQASSVMVYVLWFSRSRRYALTEVEGGIGLREGDWWSVKRYSSIPEGLSGARCLDGEYTLVMFFPMTTFCRVVLT